MILKSNIERSLWAYLSERKRAEIQDYLDSLEDDAPMECANCGQVIGDHDSFCGEECRTEFTGSEFGCATEPQANEPAGAVKAGQQG